MTPLSVHDARQCSLGEGPLWHPLRSQLFWFDINAHQLLTAGHMWQFDEYVSAAGWVDKDTLLVASETQLFAFDLRNGTQTHVAPLEADTDVTRSNDGRADPQGGFWIGTMGKAAEPGAGAIYRYFKGQLRKLFAPITISNSICFSPDGRTAYFCDTPQKQIMAVDLDPQGWPETEPRIAVDLTSTGENPDGSVVDAQGNIWNAQWGSGRVACYTPAGDFVRAIDVPGTHTTCPAFGGPNGDTLFVTSATEGLTAPNAAQGQTFAISDVAMGQKEHQVIL